MQRRSFLKAGLVVGAWGMGGAVALRPARTEVPRARHPNRLRINGDLDTYIRRMRERNIQVGRPFPPMLQYNRLSIGLPEEMEVFADALRSFRTRGWV